MSDSIYNILLTIIHFAWPLILAGMLMSWEFSFKGNKKHQYYKLLEKNYPHGWRGIVYATIITYMAMALLFVIIRISYNNSFFPKWLQYFSVFMIDKQHSTIKGYVSHAGLLRTVGWFIYVWATLGTAIISLYATRKDDACNDFS